MTTTIGNNVNAGLDNLSSTTSDRMDEWSDTAQDTIDRLSDDAGDHTSQLAERGDRLVDDTREYIAAHPLRTLGIAAAAGFLVGRMLR
jgi:ElaB/YqjD/DUF883 family membrane-anchored ribosome-binding protein